MSLFYLFRIGKCDGIKSVLYQTLNSDSRNVKFGLVNERYRKKTLD